MASNDKVLVNIDHSKLKVLDKISLQKIDLIGFYYTDTILTAEQIKVMMKETIPD